MAQDRAAHARPLGRRFRRLSLRALIVLLEKILWFFPRWAVLQAGAVIGTVASLLQPKRGLRARDNLAHALGDEYDRPALRRIERRVFRNMGRNLAEVCWVAARPARCDRLVSFEGLEHLEAARARGHGVVLVSGHMGSWEIMACSVVRHGLPLSVIARQTSEGRISEFVVDVRQRLGVETILRGATGAARVVLRALRSGGGLAALIDQDFRGKGIVIDFFGRPARTPTGPISLALRAGAPLVYFLTWRLADGTHRVRFEEPIELDQGADPIRTVEEATIAFTRWLEARIREHPDQWVWIHRRWRRGLAEGAARPADTRRS